MMIRVGAKTKKQMDGSGSGLITGKALLEGLQLSQAVLNTTVALGVLLAKAI